MKKRNIKRLEEIRSLFYQTNKIRSVIYNNEKPPLTYQVNGNMILYKGKSYTIKEFNRVAITENCEHLFIMRDIAFTGKKNATGSLIYLSNIFNFREKRINEELNKYNYRYKNEFNKVKLK